MTTYDCSRSTDIIIIMIIIILFIRIIIIIRFTIVIIIPDVLKWCLTKLERRAFLLLQIGASLFLSSCLASLLLLEPRTFLRHANELPGYRENPLRLVMLGAAMREECAGR